MHQRNCRQCNTNFLSKHSDAKYCRSACRQAAYRRHKKDKVSKFGVFVPGSGIVCWQCSEPLTCRQEKFCSDKCRMQFNRRERQADGALVLSPLMRRRLKDVVVGQTTTRNARTNPAYPGFKWLDRDKWVSIVEGNVHSLATAQVNELSNNYGGVLSALGLCSDLAL